MTQAGSLRSDWVVINGFRGVSEGECLWSRVASDLVLTRAVDGDALITELGVL